MATKNDKKLEQLIKKRTNIKSDLNRFKIFTEKINSSSDSNAIKELQLRLARFKPIIDTFNEIQAGIEDFDPSKYTDSHDAEKENFENDYFSLAVKAVQFIESHSARCVVNENVVNIQNNSVSNSDVNTNAIMQNNSASNSDANVNVLQNVSHTNPLQNTNHIKLPTLTLPTFSGAYHEWLNFYDTFRSLIHDNVNLSDIQKFHYLRSILKGDAAVVIQSLEVSTSNYEVAWQLLKRRFENKHLIIHNHVKALFEMECIKKESHAAIQQLLNNTLKHINALNMLKEPTQHWDTLLIYLVSSKLDPVTQREWEKLKSENSELSKFDDLTSMLSQKCQLLDSLQSSKHSSPFINKASAVSHITVNNQIACKFCKGSHPLYLCSKFLQLSISDRISEISKLKLCKNCLKYKHPTKECKSSSNCRHCHLRHNSLLHLPSTQQKEELTHSSTCSSSMPQPASSYSSANNSTSPTVGLNCANLSKCMVLLPTALAKVSDSSGNKILCRILLDSASQSNFITHKSFTRLGLNGKKINFPISGISNSSTNVHIETKINIYSIYNGFQCTVSCLVLSDITQNLPQRSFEFFNANLPNDLQLADPDFNTSSEIDILLGAEMFFRILCTGQIELGKQLPIVQNTRFGWVVSGRMSIPNKSHSNGFSTCCLTVNQSEQNSIQDQLSNFWQLEEVEQPTSKSLNEDFVEQLFSSTTIRNEDGRFIVRLPFNENIHQLGESYNIAKRRFLALEKRLIANPSLMQMYAVFMQEYERLNHMSVVSYSEEELSRAYFLPHHAVIKPDSTTTKLRVVFDGSCKSSTGFSLNDTLRVGPTVQPELFTIILRFRLHKYAITSDCEKMYRQVLVHPDDRIYQNILWRYEPNGPINCYQLNTVTYGTSSASYLSTRCLLQIASDNEKFDPEASSLIKNCFYVDDFIASSDGLENTVNLITRVDNLLSSSCFPLRKWASNNSSILKHLSQTDTKFYFSNGDIIKTLGLSWDPKVDEFQYPITLNTDVNVITKRSILSSISRIFDPLGLLGPIVIIAKIILQRLWQANLDWDDPVSADLSKGWSSFHADLPNIHLIKIPRHVLCSDPLHIQLHAFCDASQTSYGACIYLRSTNSNHHVNVNLLCAKSKVAPIKVVTLPKLELCAAHLLAKLVSKIIPQLYIKVDEVHLWTDSTIVLAWLKKSPTQLKQFVANRVSHIVTLTERAKWHHVSSNYNPADIISRGSTAKKLFTSDLWWHGPSWLSEDSSSWPHRNFDFINIEVPETKSINKIALICTFNYDFINEFILKYSSLIKTQRIFAFCLRFINNCKSTILCRRTGSLTVAELNDSLKYFICAAQSSEFSQDIRDIIHNKLSSKSRLLSLTPFLDEHKILRVRGRLRNSNLPYDQKHPILLPSKHHLTYLIISHIHRKNLHPGLHATLNLMRLNYWPISGISSVKRVLRQCVSCRRIMHCSTQSIMGELPTPRVVPSRPFAVCGTDFAGPFAIREYSGKGRKISKAFLCIFVCFSTKAVHLETVSSLSTEAFIACLKRFIARRGLCHTIYSDNGSNFIGCNNELKKLYKLLNADLSHTEIQTNFLSQQGINWKFIPSRSPHFGGLWEAAIKCAKRQLYKVVSKTVSLTFEELNTLFTQIEGILNSRPLIPLSSDINDLNFLTPAHFLVGGSLLALPEPSLLDTKTNYLRRYQLIQKLHQDFWRKWSTDYLNILQKRNKWQQNQGDTIKLGDLVLLKETAVPPMIWRIGRIVAVHPDSEGIIRVVTVRTSTGVTKRAVNQVCILLENEENCI